MRPKTIGRKSFNHPLVGPLTLEYETFTVSGSAGQLLAVYHAAPDSPDAQALALLGTLTAEPTPRPIASANLHPPTPRSARGALPHAPD